MVYAPTDLDAGALDEATRLYRQGAFEDAVGALEALLARAPDLASAHYLRGVILKDAGDAQEAVRAFDRAIGLDPSLDRAFYHRGGARSLAGDQRGALEDLNEACAREPDFLFAVYNRGVVAVALRRWDQAKDAFARCLALDPASRDEYVDLLVEIGRSEAQEEAYGQSHRIKNQIGVVGDRARRLVQLLRRAACMEPEVLDEANHLTADLQHVFEDLVRFLRAVDQDPPEVDVIDMPDLLDRCLFALSPKLRGVRVEREIEPWLPEVIGDRRSLGEALVNVLANAVEACAPDPLAAGVASATSGAERASAVITVRMRAADDAPELQGVDALEIEVRDNGPGFESDALPHVFNLGYTTKRFGSGVGLTYVDRVVRAHGGRVEADSLPEGGASVRLVLPASPSGAPTLRTLSLRSVLFEDLRPLSGRSGRRA